MTLYRSYKFKLVFEHNVTTEFNVDNSDRAQSLAEALEKGIRGVRPQTHVMYGNQTTVIDVSRLILFQVSPPLEGDIRL